MSGLVQRVLVRVLGERIVVARLLVAVMPVLPNRATTSHTTVAMATTPNCGARSSLR